jgi:hypothetical protein
MCFVGRYFAPPRHTLPPLECECPSLSISVRTSSKPPTTQFKGPRVENGRLVVPWPSDVENRKLGQTLEIVSLSILRMTARVVAQGGRFNLNLRMQFEMNPKRRDA